MRLTPEQIERLDALLADVEALHARLGDLAGREDLLRALDGLSTAILWLKDTIEAARLELALG